MRNVSRAWAHPARALVFAALTMLTPIGCSDSADLAPLSDSGIEGRDVGEAPVDCSAAPEGTSCGGDRHCVGGRCLHNVCGDGIRAGSEECDDGNSAIGDGCSPSCRLELAQCDDGSFVVVGENCGGGVVPNPADGGVGTIPPGEPPVPADCPPLTVTFRRSGEVSHRNLPIDVEAEVSGAGQNVSYYWFVDARLSNPPASDWVYDIAFDGRQSLSTSVRCTRNPSQTVPPTDWVEFDQPFHLLIARPGCPTARFTTSVRCTWDPLHPDYPGPRGG